MHNHSRGLRERIVRGLAKVGLVWSLAVLGFVFTATAAASASPPPSEASASFSFVNSGEAPRTAGLALALTVLSGGFLVLVVGSVRTVPTARTEDEDVVPDSSPTDLSLALGLGLAPYTSVA